MSTFMMDVIKTFQKFCRCGGIKEAALFHFSTLLARSLRESIREIACYEVCLFGGCAGSGACRWLSMSPSYLHEKVKYTAVEVRWLL